MALKRPVDTSQARGLAGMLAVARLLRAGDARPRRPVVFAATVGEEGAGDGGTGVPPTASVFAGSGAVGLPEQADTLSRAIRMQAIGGAG